MAPKTLSNLRPYPETDRDFDLTEFDSLLSVTTLLAFVATVVLAFVMPRLRRSGASPITAGLTPVMPDEVEKLPVATEDPDYKECVAVSQHVADLMIADEWTEIADKISNWEANLTSTPGGARYHEIAVKTCLSGLQGLIDDSPRDTLADLDEAEVEVGHFMDTHRQSPGDHMLALLAARAHMALGEACAGDEWPESQRRAAWRKMAQHFIAAGAILEPFDALAHMSPLLAEAHYRHALGSPGGDERLDDLFRDWIELDPSNSNIYSAHVTALVALDRITGDDVLAEADRAMQRTEDTLGFGGYALFFMPLLTEYDSARDLLDHELYAAALMDLASNSATQSEINLAAAALLTEMEASTDAISAAYKDTLILMIRQHMTEIHPRIWPISTEEVQELVAEAARAAPDIGPEIALRFDAEPSQPLAA